MKKKQLYPNALKVATAQLTGPVKAAAEAYAERLRLNVSAGPRSGAQYPGLPRQSSSPSEMPQEQSSGFKDTIDAKPTSNPLVWRAGSFGGDQDQARALEYGTLNMAQRAPLQKTADDPETRQEMLEAAKKAR